MELLYDDDDLVWSFKGYETHKNVLSMMKNPMKNWNPWWRTWFPCKVHGYHYLHLTWLDDMMMWLWGLKYGPEYIRRLVTHIGWHDRTWTLYFDTLVDGGVKVVLNGSPSGLNGAPSKYGWWHGTLMVISLMKSLWIVKSLVIHMVYLVDTLLYGK